MKRTLIMLAVVGVLFTGNAQAQQQQKTFGLGIILGEPTGLSLKHWISGDRAVDAGIAWSFSENDSLHLHMDYLWHWFGKVGVQQKEGRMPLYVGIGGRVKFKEENDGRGRNDDDTLVGVRVPFGLSFLFNEAPVELFFEVVPVLDVAPDSDLDINAAVGARFYF